MPPPTLREELEEAAGFVADDAKAALGSGDNSNGGALARAGKAAAAGKRVFGALSGAWARRTEAGQASNKPRGHRRRESGAAAAGGLRVEAFGRRLRRAVRAAPT